MYYLANENNSVSDTLSYSFSKCGPQFLLSRQMYSASDDWLTHPQQWQIQTLGYRARGGSLSAFLLALPAFLPSAIFFFFYPKLDSPLFNKLFTLDVLGQWSRNFKFTLSLLTNMWRRNTKESFNTIDSFL